MTQLKRSRYFMVTFEDQSVVDLGAFLRGRIDLSPRALVSVISALTESEHRLNCRDLEVLSQVPAEQWSDRSRLAADHRISQERLDALVAKGLLISDSDDPDANRLRQREERFTSCQWHPSAAFYNLMTKHPSGLNKDDGKIFDIAAVAASSQDETDRFVDRYGYPPDPFHRAPGDGKTIGLPLIEKEGGLYRALKRRKTVRAFNTTKAMRRDDLATLLYYVFGCHGHTKLSKGVSLLRKTSPSGGSLHPVEVYPLILNVAGVETGLYHYQTRDHSLARIRQLESWEAEALAIGMAAGQDFAGNANVLLLMTARFNRNFWKYRRRARTYSVILQDVGHLSQTFYLVCSDLNLGAFYAAYDGSFVEEALGLDGIEEGAIGLAGCGEQVEEGLDYSLDFEPYEPGPTGI